MKIAAWWIGTSLNLCLGRGVCPSLQAGRMRDSVKILRCVTKANDGTKKETERRMKRK